MGLLPSVNSIIALLCFTTCFSVTRANDTGINITTSDPNLINGVAHDYVTNLILATPPHLPAVFRVDTLTDDLVEHSKAHLVGVNDTNVQITFVMNGLRVTNIWTDVIQDKRNGGTPDLSVFVAALLNLLPGKFGIEPYPNLLRGRQAALREQETRNFTQEIETMYQEVLTYYNAPNPNPFAPLYVVSYGYEDSTNANTVGLGNQCGIFLNLGAKNMLKVPYWRSAVIHETWHCLQNLAILQQTPTLWQKVLIEGVAMHLTALTDPSLTINEILFWSDEELEQAQEVKEELFEAFEKVQDETDPEVISQWYSLDNSISDVPEAPSRSGYYLAMLAVEEYANNLDIPVEDLPKHLVDLSASEAGQKQIYLSLDKAVNANRINGNGGSSSENASTGTSSFNFKAFIASSILVLMGSSVFP